MDGARMSEARGGALVAAGVGVVVLVSAASPSFEAVVDTVMVWLFAVAGLGFVAFLAWLIVPAVLWARECRLSKRPSMIVQGEVRELETPPTVVDGVVPR